MQGLLVDSPQGNFIQSNQEMILRFTSEISSKAQQWTDQLILCPVDLEVIERTVHNAYARGADLLVAAMISAAMNDSQILVAAEQTRQQFSRPLQKGRERPVVVQLLGGMLIWAVTLYCAPKEKRFRRDDAPRVGLDITLAQFGFGKAVSPGLQSRVACQVALCPSIAFAHTELTRQGVQLDVKAVKGWIGNCRKASIGANRWRTNKDSRQNVAKTGVNGVGRCRRLSHRVTCPGDRKSVHDKHSRQRTGVSRS